MLIVRESDCDGFDRHRDIRTSDEIGDVSILSDGWEYPVEAPEHDDDRPAWNSVAGENLRMRRLEGLRDAMVEEMMACVKNNDFRGMGVKAKEISEVDRELMELATKDIPWYGIQHFA